MLSNIISQIKNLDNSEFVDIYITKLMYTQFCNTIDFANFYLVNGSQQDIYDVKNTFKYIKLLNFDIVRKHIQVLIIDDYKLAKFILNNNYIKYLIFIGNEEEIEFQNFLLSKNASTDKYTVFINKQTCQEKLYSQSFHPTNNIQLLPENNNVNIIIPIFNNTSYTIKCLKLLTRYTSNLYKVNIILIDNGSDKQSIKLVEDFCKHNISQQTNIVLLKQSKNIGYTLAINIGIKYSLQKYPASYTILMHNDVQVPPHYLDNLLKHIKDNTVAVVPITSDMIIDQGFNNIREKNIVPNFPQSFYRLKTAQTTELLQKLYKDFSVDINPRTFRTKMICIAFNTLIFQKLGLLDPLFIDGYSSDDDYIARIFLNGYNVKLVPAVSVKHKTGTTFRVWNNNAQDLIKLKAARYLQYKLINSLNIDKNKKTVIYTCNFGYEENTIVPKLSYYNTNDFDYIYFTDKTSIQIPQPWLKIDIHHLFKLTHIQQYDPEKFKAWVKINPHMLFRNYQNSIYIDNNYDMIAEPKLLLNLLKAEQFLYTFTNKKYANIKNYCQIAKLENLDTAENINNFYNSITNQNIKVKNNIGILDTSLLIRKHNQKDCMKLMHEWWKYVYKFSKLDMLSFTYIILKQKINIMPIQFDLILNKYIKNFNK